MDQNVKEIGNSSTPADSGDLPSDEVLPAPTDVPPLQVTDCGTGTKSNSNGSDTKNEVEANREEKLVEKEAKGSSRTNVEDKRSPEDVLKEMQMQKTHDLYCPNCTHNITRTAELFEKGKEKFQYNNENSILSFVIVVYFKYPFVFLPWLYSNTPVSPPSSFPTAWDEACETVSSRDNRRIREPPGERDSHRLRVHRLLSSTRATERERNRRFLEESTVREQTPFPSSTRETPVDVDGEDRDGEKIRHLRRLCGATEKRKREREERKKRERLHRSSAQYASDERAPSVVSETPKKHVPDWLRFVLVVVLLLPSALVLLWVPPSPSPLSPSPIPPPTPHTNGSLAIDIPDPQKVPEDATEIDGNLIPHGPDVVEDDKPIWPSPSTIVNKGGLVHFYWVKYLPSSRVLYVISLLLLAALALCWPSMTQTKGTEPEEDEKEVLGDKEGVPSLIGGLSTRGNKTNGSERAKEIPPPPMAPQPTTFAKTLIILRQHIVVPVHNVLQTELDILKSIVYGGLIESITSFGVVSSAAASGTSTLNVMALGLANFIQWPISHHLQQDLFWQLYGLVMSERFFPHAHIDNATDMKDKIDPYKQLLGNRNNVVLHCIVVVVSFIFFGVIPPLFYGFSFKTTDNRYYEATVFVAASLLCVITLSFGKAHAFKKDKLKTVAVYTGIAIGASAFSCIASQHVRGLLEKYEFHKIASEFAKK
uniref:Membrane protein of ER body-like protein n=1 Tax=Brassica campestris TaxID=3711 RepID=M4D1P3_BRACM